VIIEYQTGYLFLGRDGKLYHATFENGGYFQGWDVCEVRTEYWNTAYNPREEWEQ
jgi:hypothetical protein